MCIRDSDTAYANLKKAIDNVEYKVVSSYGDDDLALDDGEPDVYKRQG